MSVQDDDVQGYALGAVFGVVGLVVAGVIALACYKGLQSSRQVATSPGAQSVYFAADGESLSPDATELLARIAESARDNAQLLILVAGVRDAAGDPALAHRRALRVRHALEANGVAPSQLVLGQPVRSRSAGQGAQGRRVEVTLQ